jgi:predicted RNase H-like nuclease (RuvC/YqgF family)
MIVKSDPRSERRYDQATECLSWITHARGIGMIIESESVKTKLKKCEENSTQLKEQYDELLAGYEKLKQENDELHKFLDHIDRTGVVEN